tara:strand:+ start:829 stop:1248 length:420 start_codon:yes stop_codon:yes gene_type:complete
MKTLAISAAIAAVLFSTAAHAETAIDLSDRNGGLTKRVMCMNAPSQNGGTPGFYIPHIGWFVAANAADITTVEGAIVMPVGVSPKDANDVTEYLLSVGLTNFELANRPNRRTTTSLVEVDGELVEVTTARRISGQWCRS